MDLRYSPLLPTAVPMMMVRPNLACASLDVVRLCLILGIPNPGIVESLLTVSISTVDLVWNIATHILAL
jgi:hypothetical protein